MPQVGRFCVTFHEPEPRDYCRTKPQVKHMNQLPIRVCLSLLLRISIFLVITNHNVCNVALLLMQIDAPKSELVPIRMGTSGDLKVSWP